MSTGFSSIGIQLVVLISECWKLGQVVLSAYRAADSYLFF